MGWHVNCLLESYLLTYLTNNCWKWIRIKRGQSKRWSRNLENINVSHQETLARPRESSEWNKKKVDVPKLEKQTPTNIPNDSGMAGREKKKSLGNEDDPKEFKCLFCGGDHRACNCPIVKSIANWKTKLEQLHRCTLCCREGHVSVDCPRKSEWKCFKCHKTGEHATEICPLWEANTTRGFSVVEYNKSWSRQTWREETLH